ncbi:MAG TPA: divergent PAP2 family protein [Dehalococcoidales bacterium]|nr:divergent PAP2 family protein [Dehalococcoidales bacterium]
MNKVLIISLCAWAISQLAKIFVVLVKQRRLDFQTFVNGGMPSSHSATVSALAVSVGIASGFNSVEFAIATILALVVMFDAASVRRWVGKQAIVLNRLAKEIKFRRPVTELEHDLREIVGHTPFQVIVGSLLGIIVAFLGAIVFKL